MEPLRSRCQETKCPHKHGGHDGRNISSRRSFNVHLLLFVGQFDL